MDFDRFVYILKMKMESYESEPNELLGDNFDNLESIQEITRTYIFETKYNQIICFIMVNCDLIILTEKTICSGPDNY